MGNIFSEGLEHIGRISEDGYIFTTSGDCIAKIEDDGYIYKMAGWGIYGKIDRDGTIRDSMSNVVGNLQADGYIYMHSQRVGRVDSDFLKKLTPDAYMYGHPFAHPNREKPDIEVPTEPNKWPFGLGTTVKLIAGTALGFWAIISAGGSLGFLGCLMAIPFCIAFVFIVCFIIKVFNGG